MDGTMPEPAVAGAAAAAAAYLRINEGVDTVLTDAARTALTLAEAFCGQWLVARPCAQTLAGGGGWQRLAAVPVRSIAGVGTLPVEAYAIDIDAGGIGWVQLRGGDATPQMVRYVAGLAEGWTTLPAPIAQGVTLLAVHLFEHRAGDAAPPAAVAALWRPHRRMRLATAARA